MRKLTTENTDKLKVWSDREERLAFIRANIMHGTLRLIVERNGHRSSPQAKAIRKLG